MKNRAALSTEPYKGVRDFYPEEWAVLSAAFATIRTTLGLWGYEEYNASPLERAELYESKTSEEIVNEQTYTFTDRGERRVTLRPEMTPTLARMVAAKRRGVPFPLRWFSIPNMFRYERPQRGRLREFYQPNIDLIGLPEGEADVEILTIAAEIMKAYGATEKDFVLRVNSRTLLSAACRAAGFLTPEGEKMYLHLLDRKAKMSPEAFRAALPSMDNDPLDLIESERDDTVREEKQRLFEIIATLKTRGITNVIFDPEIVRGFDYYTGMIFELYDTNIENPRAIAGGGRYDGLVALFGGESIPCVGFALGDVTLLDFLTTHNLAPKPLGAPELYIGTPSPGDTESAHAYAGQLRTAGVRTFVNLTPRALGDQIRDAARRGIPYFIAYGEQEATPGILRLKTLATSEEVEVQSADLAERIKSGSVK